MLDKYEKKGEYQAPEYQDAMLKTVYGRHICRLDPWPDLVERAFKHMNEPPVHVGRSGGLLSGLLGWVRDVEAGRTGKKKKA